MHLDRTTRRILGSLLEKRFTTPEQYPLTLNALVLACNQKSNRDPVVEMAEFEVEGCLKQLRIEGWVTIVERDYGRAVRYSERFIEKLGLSTKESAVLAELMLRGPQTEQELERRCERMVPLGSLEETLSVLRGLVDRRLAEHLPRETGQRVARWRHLLTPPDEVPTEEETARASAPAEPAQQGEAPPDEPTTRILGAAPTALALTAELASLRAEVAALRARVDRLEAVRPASDA